MRLLERFSTDELAAELVSRHEGRAAAVAEPEAPARRDWHPSGASLAWWDAHGPGRAELPADRWDAHDLISRHLQECGRCRGEVERLRAAVPANTITRHRSRWVLTGNGPEVAEFRTAEELLAIPWVKAYAAGPTPCTFDLVGSHLVARVEGDSDRIVGRLASVAGLDLPRREWM